MHAHAHGASTLGPWSRMAIHGRAPARFQRPSIGRRQRPRAPRASRAPGPLSGLVSLPLGRVELGDHLVHRGKPVAVAVRLRAAVHHAAELLVADHLLPAAEGALGRVVGQQAHELLALEPLVAVGLLAHHLVLALADHQLLEAELVLGALEDLLLHRVRRGEPEDEHRGGLPDAVAPRLRLHVVLWVPVWVEDDHRVRRDEVDAHAARAGAEEEEEGAGGRVAEAVDGRLAPVPRDGAVEPLVGEAAEANVVLDEVEEHLELGEEEHAVALGAQVREELVQEHELARGGHEALEPHGVRGIVQPLGLGHAFYEEGVVAAVAQLHAHVVEGGARGGVRAPEEHLPVLLEDGPVAALLEVCDLHVDERLRHGRQAEVHVCLLATEEVGPQLVGEAARRVRGLEVPKVREEGVQVAELVRVEEIEDGPELRHVVLQRRAGERQLARQAQLA
mmetsp:Transcript_8508/g.29000  ORF Transcript_8508/g.29000 Transcript_8508/m.29000 type:complete len:449 (-) Transcript_8508:403-1749(-)